MPTHIHPFDKCKKVLDKVDSNDIYEVFNQIKAYCHSRITEYQKEVQNKASEFASKAMKLSDENVHYDKKREFAY
jgi:hypothetical protein